MGQSKKKKAKRRKRPVCGLCGKRGKLTKTECCGQWICDDEDQYVMFSYARNSCYRNHRRYTLCGYHFVEGHSGDWKACKQCRDDFSDDLEMYVEYGTNEYNFEKLPNPPAFEPTYCSECGERIVKANGGYTVKGDAYTCGKCDSGPLGQAGVFNPLAELGGGEYLDDEEEGDDYFDDNDRPQHLSGESIDDIPESVRDQFEEISALVGEFAFRHDHIDFYLLCMDMNTSLCVQFPEVVRRGKAKSWACGIVHALGMINFLFDPKTEPYIERSEVYSFFGVSQATMQSKSQKIREIFGVFQVDPEWSLPEMILQNPMVWMVLIDGMMIDIREASPETQQKALDMGLIPILPDDFKREIAEQKQMIKEFLLSVDGENGKIDPPPAAGGPKPNIRIVDYLSGDAKHSEPQEETPLFDPPEKE